MSAYGTAEYNQRFGEKLRNLMHKRGKTPAMMAHDLKISKGSISNWTTGKRLPRAKALSSICLYLNCSRSDLLPEDEPTPALAPSPIQGIDPLVDAALQIAGYGHLRKLVSVAKDADPKNIEKIIRMLETMQSQQP